MAERYLRRSRIWMVAAIAASAAAYPARVLPLGELVGGLQVVAIWQAAYWRGRAHTDTSTTKETESRG